MSTDAEKLAAIRAILDDAAPAADPTVWTDHLAEPRFDGSCRYDYLEATLASNPTWNTKARRVFKLNAVDAFHLADHARGNVEHNTGGFTGGPGMEGVSYDYQTREVIPDVLSIPAVFDTEEKAHAWIDQIAKAALGPTYQNPAGAGF